MTFLHFSHLEEDPLYIAYADMMAKVTFKAFIKLGKIILGEFLNFSTCLQSCAEDEEEEEEEGKEKTFEVRRRQEGTGRIGIRSRIILGHWICHSLCVFCVACQEKEMEKQKILYQQARLHARGAAEMVLQMISASKGNRVCSCHHLLPYLELTQTHATWIQQEGNWIFLLFHQIISVNFIILCSWHCRCLLLLSFTPSQGVGAAVPADTTRL